MHLFIVLHEKHVSFYYGGKHTGSEPHSGTIKSANKAVTRICKSHKHKTIEITFAD